MADGGAGGTRIGLAGFGEAAERLTALGMVPTVAGDADTLERMMVHGPRRAAEMREVAAPLREPGLPDRLAAATAERPAEIDALGRAGADDGLARRADRILARLR